MERPTRVLPPDGEGAGRIADRQSGRQHADAGFQRGDPAVRIPLQALSAAKRDIEFARGDGVWLGRFRAMGGPCEVLAELGDESAARSLVDKIAATAWRIEDKFSRYLPDNIVARINTSGDAPVEVDDETANLLDFAALVHRLSDGMFDITSGVLRRAWTFDGSSRVPSRAEIDALLPLV